MRDCFEHADWIFVNGFEKDVCNAYFDYQTEFEIKKRDNVKIYLSASTLYALYLNGQFVDCGQYPSYEEYQVYDEIDISKYLVEGKNCLELTHYVIGTDTATHRKQIPGVIFSIWQGDTCLANSNQDVLSRTNAHYKSGEMEFVSVQLGYTFQYDACVDESNYQKSVLADKPKNLFSRPIQKLIIEEQTTGTLKGQGVFHTDGRKKPIGKIMQESYLSSRRAKELFEVQEWFTQWKVSQNPIRWSIPEDEPADGIYLIMDAGEESVGFLNLDFEVPEACDVLIGYGEHLEDLRVRSFIDNRNFCVRYHAKAGKNQFFQPFLRLGMRYLQLHIYSKTGTLYQAGIRNTYYPLQKKEMEIIDPLHRKIYEVGTRTLHMCMHEHYEDCPWREQGLYTFDSRVQMLCGYYAFGEFAFAKASLRLIALSLREDGLLELNSPAKVPVTIPAFTTIFIRQLKEYMDYSKDVVFIQEVFKQAKAIVEGFEKRIDETGLVPCYAGSEYWNFYEWRDGLGGAEYFTEHPPYDCPLNAFISDAFRCFARICEVVRPELADHYDVLHSRLNQNIHQAFFDEARNVYLTRLGDDRRPLHALTQALAVYVGATPNNVREQVIENMLTQDVLPCSLSSSIYLYDVLLQSGEQYKEYVKQEIEKIWGRMVYEGATTFWETDDGEKDFFDAGSLCHGWSAVPVYLYGRYCFLLQ